MSSFLLFKLTVGNLKIVCERIFLLRIFGWMRTNFHLRKTHRTTVVTTTFDWLLRNFPIQFTFVHNNDLCTQSEYFTFRCCILN